MSEDKILFSIFYDYPNIIYFQHFHLYNLSYFVKTVSKSFKTKI